MLVLFSDIERLEASKSQHLALCGLLWPVVQRPRTVEACQQAPCQLTQTFKQHLHEPSLAFANPSDLAMMAISMPPRT